ncbi:MAG: hypothetical protein RL226_1820 [Bacteroidota bacterium]|jgi:DNA primase
MIPREVIDQIMHVAVIEDVVGDYVQLKKSGSAYRGLSPFTNERTPSFFVVPSKGIFKCFSSGKAGNVVTFLMEHEKLSYPEALKQLAQRYNIEIVEEAPDEEVLQERSEKESLLAVTQFAAEFFQRSMWDDEDGQAIGLSYFQERGFREDIIRRFQLGYSPDRSDALVKAATAAGFDKKWLKAAGLVKEGEHGEFDFFRGRVMFPIQDVTGRVIAFGGRTLRTDKKIAKYFNSPESLLYNKSRVLYGIYSAKNLMVKEDRCYLVEGYTDVIAMVQAGIENVVASSGTALTEDQVRLIKRYTQNIVVLYDGDPAGIRASFRGINLILKTGLNVRVVLFPDGDDPDSYAKKVSSEELKQYIEQASQDFISFKTSILAKDAAGDPLKRAAMITDVVESIAHIPDAIKRSVYIQECSALLKMDEQVLLIETNKHLRKQAKGESGANVESPPLLEVPPPLTSREEQLEVSALAQERDLIRLMLNYGSYPVSVELHNIESGEMEPQLITVSEYLLFELQDEAMELHDETLRKVTQEYARMLLEHVLPDDKHFSQHPDQEVAQLSAELLSFPYTLSENWSLRHNIFPETEEMNLAKAVKDCIYRLKLRHVMVMIHRLEQEIATTNDDGRLDELLKEKVHLDHVKVQLSRYFGSTIL